METPPIFNSVEDECRYWKERAKHYYKEWIDAKQEFDEFVEDSRQLEAEMEATLEQKDTVVRDLRKQTVQLEKENESLRIKLDSFSIEFANIEKQLTTTQREKDNMKAYLRQLEQKNDDLERAHRILSESIAGFETMLDKAYEKNALLESEVDEKEVLQEKLQRLMDETRDLKQELNVRVRHQSGSGSMNGVVIDKKFDIDKDECSKVFDSQQIQTTTTMTTIMSTGTPMTTLNHSNNTTVTDSLRHPDNMLNGNAMTASSRTTALNIVADMLRKLNLDKTLLCSGCDKFRCICERPLQQNNKNLLSTSTSSMTSSTSSSSCIRNNNNSNTTSSNNFGTNIFKRLSQKFGDAITNTSDNNNPPSNNHAMETKLKAYRDQTPTPKQ